MKTYAIADLHGRNDLLIAALAKFHEHRAGEYARFIVLGDYVDRGPSSASIIQLLRAIEGKHDECEVVVLKGNHEDMMTQVCELKAMLRWWMGNGGGATLLDYGYVEGDMLTPLKPQLADDIAWLKQLPVYFETDKQVFVHAGLDPKLSLSQQDEQNMMWQCYDKHKWADETLPHADTSFEKHVVHGHEQWSHGPILLEGRTDLDTFAWHDGRLAIGVFDDSQGKPLEILEVTGPMDPRYATA